MDLFPAAREYARWDITTDPGDVALAASFDAGDTWHDLTRDDTGARLLVAGPDATDNPPGTVVLTAGTHHALVRALDTPEVVIRHAGVVRILTLQDRTP